MPHTWLYGRCRAANCPVVKTDTRSSTSRVLSPTDARITSTPSLRSSGTRVAMTFSMPPYPSGGTGSHGPALTRTLTRSPPARQGDVAQRRAFGHGGVGDDDLPVEVGQCVRSAPAELGDQRGRRV